MIKDISNRLLRDFAECLRSGLERPADAGGASAEAPAAPLPAKPVGGLRLLLGALWDRLRRLFRRSS